MNAAKRVRNHINKRECVLYCGRYCGCGLKKVQEKHPSAASFNPAFQT